MRLRTNAGTGRSHHSTAYGSDNVSGVVVAPMTFVSGSSQFNSAASTSLVVPVPASIVAGNMLVALAMKRGTLNNTNWATLAGWTLQGQFASTDVSCGTAALYTRTAGGSEPGSYTFTSAVNGFLFGGMAQYTAGTLDAFAFQDDNAGNNPVGVSSVTPTRANDIWLAFGLMYNNSGTAGVTTPPAGMTSRIAADATASNFWAFYLWDSQLASAAPTGTKSITFTTNNVRANTLSLVMHP